MLTSEGMEVDKIDDEQGMPEASEQPNGELALDGGKTDSETGLSPPKQGEDTLEKPDSEFAQGVPVEGKAAPIDDPGGSEEKESSLAGDTGKDSGEILKQLPAVIELSSEIGADPATEIQVDVETLMDSESKTDHGNGELAEDGEKEKDNEPDKLVRQELGGDIETVVDGQDEQGLDTGRVRTLVDEEGASKTAVDDGCLASNAGEGQDKSDMAVSPGGRDDGGSGGEGLDNREGALTGKSMEGIVGMSIGLEPLEDIIEEDEEVEQREDPVDREELLARTKEVLLEQERLKSVNAQLQHKIAEYLAKKKSEERPDPGRNVTDQEKRYNQCMAALEVLEMDLSTLQQRSELQYAHLQVLRDQKLAEVKQATDNFAMYMKDTAITAVHSRTGRRLHSQEVEQFQVAEDKKEVELIQVRLENIKLQNKIGKLEAQIKEKEQLAEGLHMIDFEQLKINNVDLNEKIEERNEDILKLKKKVTSTVQVLTHVKEKLQFLQAENGEKRTALRNIDEIVAKKRDHLTRTKQARDALRMDNLKLKQKGGLVGHPALLGDFEERQDQNEELKIHLEKLQQRHSELTVICDGLRKKVEQARTIHPRNI